MAYLKDSEVETLIGLIGRKKEYIQLPFDGMITLSKTDLRDLIEYAYNWGVTDGSDGGTISS